LPEGQAGSLDSVIRDFYSRFRVLIHEVTKFGIVGILAFVITVVLTNVLTSSLKMGWVEATAVATIVATVFSFFGNRHWAFRHRKGKGLGREGTLFVVFNAIGLLIQTGVVAFNEHALGHHDTLSNNIALVCGVAIATLFRLYSYRRWVFLAPPAEPPAAEQLEPEVTDV
jgi:putative flippase GtrA